MIKIYTSNDFSHSILNHIVVISLKIKIFIEYREQKVYYQQYKKFQFDVTVQILNNGNLYKGLKRILFGQSGNYWCLSLFQNY